MSIQYIFRFLGAVLLTLAACNNALAARMAIPFTLSNNVGVIDASTQSTVASVDVGGTAYVAPVKPGSSLAYVPVFSGVNANKVVVVDLNSATVVSTVVVGLVPINVTFSTDGSKAFVSNYLDSSISVIDTASYTVSNTVNPDCPVGGGPVESVFTTLGLYYVCLNSPSSSLRLLDPVALTSTLVANVGNAAYTFAINMPTNRAYVSNFGDHNITVINLATNSVVTTITGAFSNPLGIAVTRDGSKVFVGDYSSNFLRTIDTSSNTVTASSALRSNIAGVGISSDGSTIYAVLRGADAGIEVLSTATGAVTGMISTGAGYHADAVWGNFSSSVVASPTVATSIPTLSEWAMLFMASLMAMLGYTRLRSRRA